MIFLVSPPRLDPTESREIGRFRMSGGRSGGVVGVSLMGTLWVLIGRTLGSVVGGRLLMGW